MNRFTFLKNIFGAGVGLAMSGELMAKIIAVAENKQQPDPIPDLKSNTQLRIAQEPKMRDLIATEYGNVYIVSKIKITKGDSFWVARHISNNSYAPFHVRVTKYNHNAICIASAFQEK